MIDVSVHMGTLAAVIIFFWTEAKQALVGLAQVMRGQLFSRESHLALALIIATIPAVLFGLVLKITGISDQMRDSVALIGATMAGFGVVLWWIDTRAPAVAHSNEWTLRQAIIFGPVAGGRLDPGHVTVGHHDHGCAPDGGTLAKALRVFRC